MIGKICHLTSVFNELTKEWNDFDKIIYITGSTNTIFYFRYLDALEKTHVDVMGDSHFLRRNIRIVEIDLIERLEAI